MFLRFFPDSLSSLYSENKARFSFLFCFSFRILSYRKVCHDYHVDLCLTLHALFGLPDGILTLNYVVHTSIIRFSVGIGVYCSCLSFGTKQCYTLYTFKCCKMCVPCMPTYTQISILSGKLDFKLYITVHLRTSVIVTYSKNKRLHA